MLSSPCICSLEKETLKIGYRTEHGIKQESVSNLILSIQKLGQELCYLFKNWVENYVVGSMLESDLNLNHHLLNESKSRDNKVPNRTQPICIPNSLSHPHHTLNSLTIPIYKPMS